MAPGFSGNGKKTVGDYPCTGMRGGRVYLRADVKDLSLPNTVTASTATEHDLREIQDYLEAFCIYFGYDINLIKNSPFTVIEPDSANPYKQMYVAN